MLIYLAMTTLCCLIAFFATKEASTGKNLKIASFKISYSAIFLILSAIPMIFVSGLRWETGVDHQNYYWVFTNILYGLNTHVEIGFK
ncbi:MAG: EpsG family protein, partial [Oscillospiraceae bacterium]